MPTAPGTALPTAPGTAVPTVPATSLITAAPTSPAGASTLRGSANMTYAFKNMEFNWNSQAHATDVVWQLDPASRMRPARANPTDKIGVYTLVSGNLAWSYDGTVQGTFTSLCHATDSGTATLGSADPDELAYIMINWTNQPATYEAIGQRPGLGGKKCMEWGPGYMESEWLSSDGQKNPSVSETGGAFVLKGGYTAAGTGFGSVSTTYDWNFSSAP